MFRVKHLNPRQGITTYHAARLRVERHKQCETPKSPPGDYNPTFRQSHRNRREVGCETPKSPPGDYNASAGFRQMPRQAFV